MTNYIDYKATVWFRIPINDIEDNLILDRIKQHLESGETPDELYNHEDLEIGQCEPMYDTEEFLTSEDNGDCPTVEIYKDGELIWNNTIGDININDL